MARIEALRLFPEFKHRLVQMEVYLARYVEVDWESGRTLVAKNGMSREIPAAVAAISKAMLRRPPRPDEEEEAQ